MECLATSFSVDQIFQFDKFVVPIEDENSVNNLLICDVALVIHNDALMQEIQDKEHQLRDALYHYFRSKNPYYFLDIAQRRVVHWKLLRILNHTLKNGKVFDVLFTLSKATA